MKKYRNIFMLLIPFLIFLFGATATFGQTSKKGNDLDVRQEEMQSLYIKAYTIIDQYPMVSYNYKFENGKIAGVDITGIPSAYNKAMLENYLLKLEHLKSEIINQKDQSGVYIVTETEPEPKDGYRSFYRDLQRNLMYPEAAREYGIEGTVFVKFIVDPNGEVKNLQVSENIDTPFENAESELETEAMKAVKSTSGDWIPGKVGEVPVNQWVSLPVKFDLENSHYTIFNN